ncbi:HEAT repeat domain-containing protein [Aeromonas veronii]|uniref:HEAT repeat domain-containing protein n=1 Tax=Aeromonas veronii TaxID=654 RepID=UPI0038D3B384
MIARLLTGYHSSSPDVRATSLMAIGESGLIDDDRLVNALEDATKSSSPQMKKAALTAIGSMLKNSNRQ